MALSVNAPAVVRNGIRVSVSEETVRFVVLAVPETVSTVVDAYGKTFAAVAVEVKVPDEKTFPVIYAVPLMESVEVGVVLPIPTFPDDVTMSAVLVAVGVEVEMRKSGEEEFA